jgi:hypothetical protein
MSISQEVGIAEHDELAGALADPSIDGARETGLPPHLDDPDALVVGVVADSGRHVLRRVVVHHDDLDLARMV